MAGNATIADAGPPRARISRRRGRRLDRSGPGDYYKDQELETAFAKQLGVPLLLANVTQQVYQMARAAGLNKQDGSAILQVLERLAGVHVGRPDGSGGGA
jgi:hypothetical protein